MLHRVRVEQFNDVEWMHEDDIHHYRVRGPRWTYKFSYDTRDGSWSGYKYRGGIFTLSGVTWTNPETMLPLEFVLQARVWLALEGHIDECMRARQRTLTFVMQQAGAVDTLADAERLSGKQVVGLKKPTDQILIGRTRHVIPGDTVNITLTTSGGGGGGGVSVV